MFMLKLGIDLLNLIYPVGSIYMSVNSVNPSTIFGGTWERWGQGRVPVGVNTSDADFNTVEKTGGAKTHTLTVAELPAHTHRTSSYSLTGYTTGSTNRRYPVYWNDTGREVDWSTQAIGGGGSHNNTQPFITCYMWKRTA